MEHLNGVLLERTKGKIRDVFYCTRTLPEAGLRKPPPALAPYLVTHPTARLRKLHTTGMPVGMPGTTFQPVVIEIDPAIAGSFSDL